MSLFPVLLSVCLAMILLAYPSCGYFPSRYCSDRTITPTKGSCASVWCNNVKLQSHCTCRTSRISRNYWNFIPLSSRRDISSSSIKPTRPLACTTTNRFIHIKFGIASRCAVCISNSIGIILRRFKFFIVFRNT